MGDLPSINQVALMGQITKIAHKPGRVFCWTFDIAVYKEYGTGPEETPVEADVTCGVGDGSYGQAVANASVGDWVTLQGKLRSGGFVQVRSLCIMKFS